MTEITKQVFDLLGQMSLEQRREKSLFTFFVSLEFHFNRKENSSNLHTSLYLLEVLALYHSKGVFICEFCTVQLMYTKDAIDIMWGGHRSGRRYQNNRKVAWLCGTTGQICTRFGVGFVQAAYEMDVCGFCF